MFLTGQEEIETAYEMLKVVGQFICAVYLVIVVLFSDTSVLTVASVL